MLRLVDVPGAFSQRAWPAAVSGRIELAISDDVLPDNAGPHVLEFDGGRAEVRPGGSGRTSVSVSDLAMLYAGADPRLLHGAGRLEGADGTDVELLAAACVSTPSLPFFF
jgi:predicted acetyltransferase